RVLGRDHRRSREIKDRTFVQRLGELGWMEGHTVTIEYRWGESRTERFPEIAADLVRPGSISLSSRQPQPHSRASRRRRSSRSCFHSRAIRLAPAWSPVWLGQAATLPA